MANVPFAERENACLRAPSLAMRQRLKSAPEKLLKSPMPAKTLTTPLASGRKAFGAINKKVSTPAVSARDKKLVTPQETKVKPVPPTHVEEYPDIEKFIPYDPLEFERYSVPEDLVPLSVCALAGLAAQAPRPREDLEALAPLPLPLPSPVTRPRRSETCSALSGFLQTLEELTLDLPPEPFTD